MEIIEIGMVLAIVALGTPLIAYVAHGEAGEKLPRGEAWICGLCVSTAVAAFAFWKTRQGTLSEASYYDVCTTGGDWYALVRLCHAGYLLALAWIVLSPNWAKESEANMINIARAARALLLTAAGILVSYNYILLCSRPW